MALLKHRSTGDANPPAHPLAHPLAAPPPLPAADLLLALRSAPTEAARREAALDLAAVPEAPEVIRALGAALGTEPAPRVRQAIVSALAGIGTDAAAAVLADLLGSEDTALRNDAIEALRQFGPAAGPSIERLLASPVPDVRIFAVSVLEGLRHPSVPMWLYAVLDQESEVNVGLAAVEALAQVGDACATAPLRAFAQRFPAEPFVAMAVDLACRRLAKSRAS